MKSGNFDVLSVDLQGSNLLEASAGTGKTYSVAILVLKLILEKEIPIEKILMVTFTRPATAELESRIRKFVRLAYKFARGTEIEVKTIRDLVGTVTEKKKQLLHEAVQHLDRLSVMTIHGFCQAHIDEFTFEANQSFDYEILTDDSSLLQNAAGKYFREQINVLDEEVFNSLMTKELKFNYLANMLREFLKGKKFYDLDAEAELSEMEALEEQRKKELLNAIQDNFDRIKAVEFGTRKDLSKKRNSPEEFLPVFINFCCKQKNVEAIKSFDFIYSPYGKNYADSLESRNILYLDFFKKAGQHIETVKRRKGYIAYDDQVKTIHAALKNEDFRDKLAKKYDAVFIDEFQDTDQYQYEIFSGVFAGNSIVFYIGDPKQSIFGWRSADLDTYKRARKATGDDPFVMDTNYRSTPGMIEALNALLKPAGDFNMFLDDKIVYEKVISGAENLGKMTGPEKEVLPVTIWEFDKNDFRKNLTAVVNEIHTLLSDEAYKIGDRRIEAGDIGVLVRSNDEGDQIKKALDELNIPSVKIDNSVVTKSAEVEYIKHLLSAVIAPKRGDINRVLNQAGIGFTSGKLRTLDDKKHIEIFLDLRAILQQSGVYTMISTFLSRYGVRQECMKQIEGQRMLTNIMHITELLHREERKNSYTPEELLIWLDRGEFREGEEYEQRIESDEDAVRISTIHKAKGLEYNIVFAPSLCLVPNKAFLKKGKVNSFKKDDEYYFTINHTGLHPEDKELFNLQAEQENRRLVYVALTRAVYKSYISLVPRDSTSSFADIKNHFAGHPLVETVERPVHEIRIIEEPLENDEPRLSFFALEKPGIEIKNKFGIHSFSALSKAHHTAPFEKTVLGDPEDYKQFIFQDLGRGANVGTALHSIFEYLEFDNPETWNQSLADASRYYGKIIQEDRLGDFKQMITHTLQSRIVMDGNEIQLSKIRKTQMLPEMEFCFSIDRVNRQVLDEIMEDEADLGGDSDLAGLMTGFIDLVFEQNGKYYILDWKSNHLGNAVDDYDQEGLAAAMKGSNYNLQYLIYTVALNRWLESRIDGFDYETHFGGVIYVFLRGVREKQTTGIFATKPDLEKVKKLDVQLG